jgi:hypothetical protein
MDDMLEPAKFTSMADTIGTRLHQNDIQSVIDEFAGDKPISATDIGESTRREETPD